MPRTVVLVSDKIQRSYHYELSEPEGQNFDPDFRPELTPPELLRLGLFGGKPRASVKVWVRSASHFSSKWVMPKHTNG